VHPTYILKLQSAHVIFIFKKSCRRGVYCGEGVLSRSGDGVVVCCGGEGQDITFICDAVDF